MEKLPRINISIITFWVVSKIWYRRLSHPSLKKTTILGNFLNFEVFQDAFYNVCKVAKQPRLPFVLRSHKTIGKFHMVHMDLWGRFHLTSAQGSSYFLIIIDDYSRFTWLYFVSNKSKVFNRIKNYINYMKT
jgi:hypothetical protein